MKRLLLTALACCLCALTTLAQEQAGRPRQLMTEAHNLRAELLQLQIEFQDGNSAISDANCNKCATSSNDWRTKRSR